MSPSEEHRPPLEENTEYVLERLAQGDSLVIPAFVGVCHWEIAWLKTKTGDTTKSGPGGWGQTVLGLAKWKKSGGFGARAEIPDST